MSLTTHPLSPAGARLQAWLDSHTLKGDPPSVEQRAEGDEPIKLAAFAALAQIDRSALWRWMVGERLPTLKSAAAIEAVTGIPSPTWLEESAHDAGT